MIPARFAPVLFGLVLSGSMSLIVSGIATARATGVAGDFLMRWIVGGWLPSWAVAFPAVLVMAPLTRRLVAALTR
jgi:Protein of unknown function (DUF2798)